MRILTAFLIMTALTASAYAQAGRGLTRPEEEPKAKVDEKGYESALKHVPGQGQQQGYDPWRIVREPPPVKEPPKDAKSKSKTKTTSRSTAKQ